MAHRQRSTSRSRGAPPRPSAGGGDQRGTRDEQTRDPVHFRNVNEAQYINPYYTLYERVVAALQAYVAETGESMAVCNFDTHKTVKSMVVDGVKCAQNTLQLELESVTQIASFSYLSAFLAAELAAPVDLSSRRSSTSEEHFFTLHVALVPEERAPPRRSIWRTMARVVLWLLLAYVCFLLYSWGSAALREAAHAVAWIAGAVAGAGVGASAGSAAPGAAGPGAGASYGAVPRPNPNMVLQT